MTEPDTTEPESSVTAPAYTSDEIMTVHAARTLGPGTVCFVGIGLPSTAANLARRLHAPDCVLVYESGCIGAKPSVLPVVDRRRRVGGDTPMRWSASPRCSATGCRRAASTSASSSAAQIDRHANLNTTVIGDYRSPVVRLPGAGGAPEIAASCGEVVITIRQNLRTFVDRLDFVTSVGHGDGGDHRERLGLRGKGPTAVITDLGILRPDEQTKELTLVSVHPGIEVDEARAATGWPLRVADDVTITEPPTRAELDTLRSLQSA